MVYVFEKKYFISISKGALKSSYDNVISAVEDFFNQWGPSTETPMEEV